MRRRYSGEMRPIETARRDSFRAIEKSRIAPGLISEQQTANPVAYCESDEAGKHGSSSFGGMGFLLIGIKANRLISAARICSHTSDVETTPIPPVRTDPPSIRVCLMASDSNQSIVVLLSMRWILTRGLSIGGFLVEDACTGQRIESENQAIDCGRHFRPILAEFNSNVLVVSRDRHRHDAGLKFFDFEAESRVNDLRCGLGHIVRPINLDCLAAAIGPKKLRESTRFHFIPSVKECPESPGRGLDRSEFQSLPSEVCVASHAAVENRVALLLAGHFHDAGPVAVERGRIILSDIAQELLRRRRRTNRLADGRFLRGLGGSLCRVHWLAS